MNFIKYLIFTIILVGMASAVSASTFHDYQFNLQKITEQSDLVFKGEVSQVEYKLSLPRRGQKPIPYTFVTYRINEIIRGQYSENTITLRFIGGMTDPKKGRFLMASGFPLFDIGDQDVLFVKNNNKYICPLVGCAQGRYRIHENKVYTEDGRQILISREGKLKIGANQRLEIADTHYLGNLALRKEYGEPTHKDPDNPEESISKKQIGQPIAFQEFIEKLKLVSKQAKSKTAQVTSANIHEDFYGIDMTARAPKMADDKQRPVEPSSELDRRERELLEANDWNPVLPIEDAEELQELNRQHQLKIQNEEI